MKAAVSLALALLVAAGVAGGVGRDDARQQPPVFRARIDMVRVDVLVTDNGRPVPGLVAGDFLVLDNGVPQKVQAATTAGDVTVALVVDRDVTGASRDLLDAMRPGETLHLTQIVEASRQPAPGASVAETLAHGSSAGTAALWDSLFAAVSRVAGNTGPSFAVLFTDGRENLSWLRGEDLVECLKRSNVVVYVVQPPGSTSVARLALQTGGSAIDASPGVPLARQFAAILDEFRQRYLLTYEPTGVGRSNGWHKLEVRLSGKKGKVQARPGYYR